MYRQTMQHCSISRLKMSVAATTCQHSAWAYVTLGSLQQQIDSPVATGSKLVECRLDNIRRVYQQTIDDLPFNDDHDDHRLLSLLSAIDALRCDFACRMTEMERSKW